MDSRSQGCRVVHPLHRRLPHHGPPRLGGLIKEICAFLGFPLKTEKIEDPACVITFLGIILNSTRMEIRLPEEKLQELQTSGQAASHAGRGSCYLSLEN